jgi:Na+/alanine symporter
MVGILFSVLITVSFGLVLTLVQANTISFAFEEAFGINRLVVGICINSSYCSSYFWRSKRIAKVAELIVQLWLKLMY